MSTDANLTTLLKRSTITDHEEILRAANTALKSSKNDIEAQHVKIVALLKLDRYEDALHVFESTGADALKEKARLEHAYALYKSGKPTEAAEVARQGSGRGYQHVEAQARYRTEEFERAAEIYEALEQDLQDDAEADLRINTCATDAQLRWAGKGERVPERGSRREDMDSFEMMYNAACGSIAKGELGRAEVLLTRARNLCQGVEDMTEEEKEAELAPIAVQQVYVLTRLGKLEEAQALAKEVDVKSVSDKSTRYIAAVNKVAASAVSNNPFLKQRLLAADLETLKPDYPFEYQSAVLKQNQQASALQAMKFDGTADATSKVLSKDESPTLDAYHNSLSVANAAAHAKNTTGKEALKQMLPLLERRPHDIGLVLTIVQLYVLTGNSASAIQLIESFTTRLENTKNEPDLSVRFAPGVVAAAVGLYHSLGQQNNVRKEYSKAAAFWQARTEDRPAGVVKLLKAAGSALIDSRGVDTQSHDIFANLHSLDSEDKFAAAGLLASSPDADASTANLQSLDRLITDIDVDALENAGIAKAPLATGASISVRKRLAEDSKPKKAKKQRKSRLPKEYDPSKAPDSERWLPLRDRSTYRPKGKKGKARQAMLSQGSAPAGESDGSRPATPGTEVVKGKQQTGGAAKKKKGKGNKW